MRKARKYNAAVTARVKKTAELTGYSEDYVNRVLGCERNNERILEVYMELEEKEEEVFKNLMHQQVNKLVPFPPSPKGGQRKAANSDKKQGESTPKRTEKAENV